MTDIARVCAINENRGKSQIRHQSGMEDAKTLLETLDGMAHYNSGDGKMKL